ncbi:phosphotransferase [Rhizobacter sp. AJA081-3]|uniref:phosphotransferase enzyme family protein n=1 Tax=Rhizobacter sp. AJA081-3 TaxID=2753607 RepID=UPI001AE0A404|nr:phosphotransferase [Rhizobacter sp. AJA081-3]QTN21949.1 phosphotransferase [Rhizobacter sp. AJA081-3]
MRDPFIETVLSRHGVRADALRCVTRLDGEVWRVRSKASPDLALRLYSASHQDPAAIGTELDLLEALAATALHVPVPQRCTEGTRLHRHPDGRYAVLLTWLDGRQHDRGLTPTRLESVGRFTGALHRVATALRAAGRVRTERQAAPLDLPAWAAGTRTGMDRLSAAHHAVLRDSAMRLHDEIEAFGRGPECWGLVHGDLHPWNLLFVRGAAGAIDFADCGMGHHAMDLAATLQYLRYPLAGNHDHRRHYAALHDALLKGYAAEHTPSPNLIRQVSVLVTARLFLTLAWILDDWPALDHRPWGPGFIDGSQSALRAWLAAPLDP